MAEVICKDCIAEGVTTVRKPALDKQGQPMPKDRCVTHQRARKKVVKQQGHARRVINTYGITSGQYWALYEAQGGVCAICRWAKGLTKALAVDHDHKKCGDAHPPEQGCPECVRGLLCGPCNQMIGRYGVESLQRAIDYVEDPPARKVLHGGTAGRSPDGDPAPENEGAGARPAAGEDRPPG